MVGNTHQLRPDEWLGQILGRDAFQLIVNADRSASTAEIEPDVRRALERMPKRPAFVWSKVSAEDVRTGRMLQSLGFYAVDTSLRFDKPVEPAAEIAGNCTVRPAAATDCERVSQLARDTFAFTRFHLDPAIDNLLAGEIKARWAANYFAGNRGDDMLVAVADGDVVGFLQLLHPGGGNVIIDLIAVDRAHQRRGIAQDMIALAQARAGGGRIVVGTQAANVASVRLYEKLGFRMTGAFHVFHIHRHPNAGEPE